MKLFLDNNLTPRIAAAIRPLVEPYGHTVVHLRERFPADTSDEAWLSALSAERGWCVLTFDRGIRKKPHERSLWLTTDVVIFFLARGWNRMAPVEQAGRLLLRWGDLVAQADLVRPPAAFLVRVKGKLSQLRL